jgi:hypothetical protein
MIHLTLLALCLYFWFVVGTWAFCGLCFLVGKLFGRH